MARDASDSEARRLAIQRRRLIREALEATAQERRRIGNRLHDDVLQHLLFARQELTATEPGHEPDVARAGAGVAEAIRLLRALVSDLHPLVMSARGLAETIAEFTREAERPGLATGLSLGPGIESRHDALVATAVRELLANVVKHAQASSADVAVSANGELVIEVADDGIGLDPTTMMQAVVDGHIGLASLIERVETVEGKLELSSRDGRAGTLVRIMLPLP